MRIKETKIYKFAELSDEAKENAVNNVVDINVNYEWWENTYYDAEHTSLLKLTSFNLCVSCSGNFIEGAEDTATKIMSEHGNKCDTFSTAFNYLGDRNELVSKYSNGIEIDIVTEDNEHDFDNECNELDTEFLRAILEDYRTILQKEYEYLCSEEAIIETIEAKEYEFTEDGQLA